MDPESHGVGPGSAGRDAAFEAEVRRDIASARWDFQVEGVRDGCFGSAAEIHGIERELVIAVVADDRLHLVDVDAGKGGHVGTGSLLAALVVTDAGE
jgi:hypothetical protein